MIKIDKMHRESWDCKMIENVTEFLNAWLYWLPVLAGALLGWYIWF